MTSIETLKQKWWRQSESPQEHDGAWNDDLSTKDLDALDWEEVGFVGRMPTPESIDAPSLLFNYLSEVVEDPDARVTELENGAEPTEGERAAWQACIADGSAFDAVNDCVRVDQVNLDEGSIWWISHEEGLGPGTEILRHMGPFPTLEAAMSQSWEWASEWHETMTDGCFGDEGFEEEF